MGRINVETVRIIVVVDIDVVIWNLWAIVDVDDRLGGSLPIEVDVLWLYIDVLWDINVVLWDIDVLGLNIDLLGLDIDILWDIDILGDIVDVILYGLFLWLFLWCYKLGLWWWYE